MAGKDRLSPDEVLRATARVPDHVVYRSFEAETLLLNLETGHYHGLNQTGGRMLELMESRDGSIAEAVEALAEEYGVSAEEIEPDMTEFCAQLAERGLIQLSTAEEL